MITDIQFKPVTHSLKETAVCIDFEMFNFGRNASLPLPPADTVVELAESKIEAELFFPWVVKMFNKQKLPTEYVKKKKKINGCLLLSLSSGNVRMTSLCTNH